jgi:hypothetical protein
MKVRLKIKIKSLAEEARIIRFEEKKWPGPSDERYVLHDHRIKIVREEARSAQLAYGFLRGKPYRQIENSCKSAPDWKRVHQLIKKYGGPLAASASDKDFPPEDIKRWAEEELEMKAA